jgi:hypothetical protein
MTSSKRTASIKLTVNNICTNIMWHVEPLLGKDGEIGDHTVAVARQRPLNSRGMVFSVRYVPKCYKHDSWSNELVVGQSPAGKNVRTEAVDIVEIRYQATTGEYPEDREAL